MSKKVDISSEWIIADHRFIGVDWKKPPLSPSLLL